MTEKTQRHTSEISYQVTRLDRLAARSADYIRSIPCEDVCTAVILGSGLAQIADIVEESVHVEYRSVPGFPLTNAPGHAGKLVLGRVSGKKVAVMSGRPHLYEGYDRPTITFPIRVLRKLGVTTLIVTNAAGAVNRRFSAGDLMLITDHIDLTFTNSPTTTRSDVPLSKRGFRYDEDLRDIAAREARKLRVKLQMGTYAAVTGPNYETEAEMKMLERIGADAVGMSTVPEAIEGFSLGMKILAVSCIANPRRRTTRLTHDHVERTVRDVAPMLARLIVVVVSSIREVPLSC